MRTAWRALLREIMLSDPVDLVVLNFANPDMVGHTGNIPATIEAVGHVDKCLGQVLEVLDEVGARVIVTADHGNAEQMLEPDGAMNTAHSVGKVPLVVLERGLEAAGGRWTCRRSPDPALLLGAARARGDDGASIVLRSSRNPHMFTCERLAFWWRFWVYNSAMNRMGHTGAMEGSA